jgi:hypothetical protein
MINYQGYLTDATGTPLNETVNMSFYLYREETDGDPLWWENQNGIVVSEGIFNVILGSSVPLDLPFDVPYYLGIWVNGEEMAPRKPLLTVPYAFNATPTAAPAFGTGLVSISPSYQECEVNEEGLDCGSRTLLTVVVARGGEVELEGMLRRTVSKNGVPEEVVEAVDITLTRQGNTITCTIVKGDVFTFTVSPAAPVYDDEDVGVRARLLTDNLVALALTGSSDPDSIKQIFTESIGIFTASASSLGTHHVQLTVEVGNYGDFSTVYLVTVPTCNACDDLVPAQSATIDRFDTETLTFTLYSADGFTAGDTCEVELRVPTGRLYDTQTVTIK